MNITEVKVRKLFAEGNVKAIVSITLDGEIAVHDLRVIQGVNRMYVSMPSRRSGDGRSMDIVHPISQSARTQLETAVFEKYYEAVAAMDLPQEADEAMREDKHVKTA
jgi:stage V sporulation protein G